MMTLGEFITHTQNISAIQSIKKGNIFAIGSAFRSENSETKNMQLHDQLYKDLVKKGFAGNIGDLIGIWEGEKELSYYIEKPESIDTDVFISTMNDLMVHYKQDAFIHGENGNIILRSKSGHEQKLGRMTTGSIDQFEKKHQGYSIDTKTEKAFLFA